MSNNVVNFTINIDGNAYQGVLHVNDALDDVLFLGCEKTGWLKLHGIFREYGVGNGQPRHGMATKSGKAASRKIYIKRTPSDWFHNPLERNIDTLGDLVADYYGDKVLVEFRKLDINTANTASHEGVL
jgi:hypothetical protein